MTAKRGQSVARSLMLFLLLVFSVSALLTAAFGVKVFRSINADSDASYALRASLNYVAGKARALDSKDCLSISDIGKTRALILSETIDGIKYNTYIYLYNGQLCELYADDGVAFDPDAGTALVAVSSCSFAFDGTALSITASAATGETRSCRVLLRSYAGGSK